MPPSSPAIEFADAKAICVANWDTNSDGELSEAEAAAVTDLNHVFGEKAITSFNELQYFTGLSMIGDEEFSLCGDEGCSRLTSVTLPETLTRIGGGAFMGCRSLEDIHLPSSLITMSDAFDFCTSLRFIYIPKAVRYVSAFRECTSLESIVVDADNPYLDSRNDCNAIIETSTNKLIAGCGNTVIPEDVVAIGQMAFAGMTGLSEVTIPDGVYDIGFDAFQGTTWYNSQPDGLVYAGKVAYRVKGQVAVECRNIYFGHTRENYSSCSLWQQRILCGA